MSNVPSAVLRQMEDAEAEHAETNTAEAEEVQAGYTESDTEQPEYQEPESRQADDWQQKYNVLKGKYDAEVPRLQAQVADLSDRVAFYSDMLSQKQQQQQEPEEKPRSWIDDLADEYDEDSSIVRAMREQEKTIKQLQSQLGGVAQSTAQTQQQRFYQSIEAKAPQWAALNNDAGFNSWLDSSGGYRRMAMNAAAQSMNADAVAALFNEYSAATPGAKPNKKAEQAKLVTPSNGGGSGDKPTQTAPVNLKEMTAKAEAMARRGKFKEADAIMAEIEQAGRIGNLA